MLLPSCAADRQWRVQIILNLDSGVSGYGEMATELLHDGNVMCYWSHHCHTTTAVQSHSSKISSAVKRAAVVCLLYLQ